MVRGGRGRQAKRRIGMALGTDHRDATTTPTLGKNLSMPLWQEKFLVVLLTLAQSQLKRHRSR